jgi:DivIVA domain-containing protein
MLELYCKKGEVIMYNERLFLTPQEILDKEFKVDAKGYRPQEVDKFLDMVIRDYTEFMNIIKKLQNDNKILAEDNARIKAEYRKLKSVIDSAEDATSNSNSKNNFNNVDLLKRISNLEKIVYGKEE